MMAARSLRRRSPASLPSVRCGNRNHPRSRLRQQLKTLPLIRLQLRAWPCSRALVDDERGRGKRDFAGLKLLNEVGFASQKPQSMSAAAERCTARHSLAEEEKEELSAVRLALHVLAL